MTIIEVLGKAIEVIEKWVPMFEQCNTPAAIQDAIILLKAQEPVEPEYIRARDDDTGLMFTATFCGNSDCEKQLTGHHNYCPHCGRPVKWE